MSTCAIQSIRVIDPPVPVVAIRVLDPEHSPLQFTATAAAILSSNCLVHVNEEGQLIRADASLGLPAHGLVRASAVQGQLCEVETGGTWGGFHGLVMPGQIFLGNSGQVTQTMPTTGLRQVVGVPVSSSKISLSIQPAARWV